MIHTCTFSVFSQSQFEFSNSDFGMIRTNGSVQYLAWYFFVIAKHTFFDFKNTAEIYHEKYRENFRVENKFLKTALSLFRQLSGVHCPAAAIISSDKTDFHSVGTHLNKSWPGIHGRRRSTYPWLLTVAMVLFGRSFLLQYPSSTSLLAKSHAASAWASRFVRASQSAI